MHFAANAVCSWTGLCFAVIHWLQALAALSEARSVVAARGAALSALQAQLEEAEGEAQVGCVLHCHCVHCLS